MKSKFKLFATILTTAIFGVGCALVEPAFVKEGLVAYYPFNGNAKDESGNGNDGEVNGATLRTDRSGIAAKAYSFDGADDYMDMGQIQFTNNSFTVSVWVNISTGTASFKHIIESGTDVHGFLGAFRIETNAPERIYLAIGDGSTYKENAVEGFNTGWKHDTWIQLSVSYNGSVVSFYQNGALMDHFASGLDIRSGDGTLIVGRFSTGEAGRQFKGAIDDIRIYDRALSEEEVKDLYELEKPKE